MRHAELLTIELDTDLQRLAQSFDCGGPSVFNAFLKGSLAMDCSYGKTFVLATSDHRCIIGYYNIGVGEVVMYNGACTMKCGGAVHINYLAVDKNYRGQIAIVGADESNSFRWSDLLLKDCIDRIEIIRKESVGFMFVTLSSSRDGYDLYHNRFGFELLSEEEDLSFHESDEDTTGGIKMYLPLDDEEI